VAHEEAKKIAKARDNYRCVICGKHKSEVERYDGAHFADVSVYPILADFPHNIFGMCDHCHGLFDRIPNQKQRKRTPAEKITWIYANVPYPRVNDMIMQIHRLKCEVDALIEAGRFCGYKLIDWGNNGAQK